MVKSIFKDKEIGNHAIDCILSLLKSMCFRNYLSTWLNKIVSIFCERHCFLKNRVKVQVL